MSHPSIHCFRDRNKNQEKEKYGGVRVKNFISSKDRANQTEKLFREGHLEIDQFNDRMPNKDTKYWLRERELAHEKQEIRFGHCERTENQNIQNGIFSNSFIDHSMKDMKMIYLP